WPGGASPAGGPAVKLRDEGVGALKGDLPGVDAEALGQGPRVVGERVWPGHALTSKPGQHLPDPVTGALVAQAAGLAHAQRRQGERAPPCGVRPPSGDPLAGGVVRAEPPAHVSEPIVEVRHRDGTEPVLVKLLRAGVGEGSQPGKDEPGDDLVLALVLARHV